MLMDIQFIAGLLIGGAITWLVTHIYYRKSNSDQKKLYSKFSKEMRDAILQDSRTKLSAQDLNELEEQKAIEARRTEIEKLRKPIYAEALAIIYAKENSRGDVDNFEAARRRLCEWAPAKVSYLPPKAIEFIFGVINRGAAYGCDLHNRELNHKTNEWFREVLQAAKEFFLQNQDIRWLPEDIKQPKQAEK